MYYDFTNDKAKYWTAILYPENMIPDWKDQIDSLLLVPFCYCIHDKDLLKEKGEERKTHVHIILAFSNTTTYNYVFRLLSKLFLPDRCAIPNGRLEVVASVKRMYDYLIHNTDDCRKKRKHLYDISERISGNNFDIGIYEQYSLEEKHLAVRELSKLIIDNFICNYTDFYIFVDQNYEEKIYVDVIKSYSSHFERLTRGNWQKMCSSRQS